MEQKTTKQDSRGEARRLHRPWLVATWPGMGSIASLAGAYLAQALGARPAGVIGDRDYFSIDHVDVSNGIARSGQVPRNLLFAWEDPRHRRDLLLFVGEAQPSSGGYGLCHRILDEAQQHGVQRVVTFAAMATDMHPSADPRALATVTAPELLAEMRKAGVEMMSSGQIGGLNGAMLAAAAERGIPAMCLLGEMPHFAAALPNPKAAMAVLRSFADVAGIELDLQPLSEQARQVEAHLLRLMEQAQAVADDDEQGGDGPDEAAAEEPALAPADRQRIERLFKAAQRDRSSVGELKAELDRLGVFAEYEDRFLDLFRS